MGLNTNLLEQLTFYGAYHRHPINQLIHFVFVPTILWTVLVWLAQLWPGAGPVPLGAVGDLLPDALRPFALLNAPLLTIGAYTLFYLVMEPVAGASWALLVGAPLWLTATAFASQVEKAGTYAAAIHVFSWYMQIHPGHAVCEKRKPALMDSLVQAFALAPLFVWFELLFLLGYRRGLYKQLQAGVEQHLSRELANKKS